MTEQFDIYERLYRAVYPPEIMPMFWKENGDVNFGEAYNFLRSLL